VRTSIDIPDDLYRALKARAALTGRTVRELVTKFVEQGLARPSAGPGTGRREPPPVIVPARGIPIPALSRSNLRLSEEQEDEEKLARSARR
jgi:hypothetical protein